ncbi:MAG: sugar ABC transporter substrate-binding protein [Spirochaetales bacterium]|nr:sugar ABC transporter substrate-binding protein [Spirochaetales bacterium]
MKKVLTIVMTVALVLMAVMPVAANGQQDSEKVMGISIDNAFPSRIATVMGIISEAEARGYKVIKYNANGDAQKQNADVENLVNEGVDALLVCAVDMDTIEVALMKAKSAGIPIVSYDRDLPESEAIDCSVGPDSYSDGLYCGEYFAEALKDKGDVTVLELLGALNDQNGIERSRGFNDGLKSASNVKIVQASTGAWQLDIALKSVQDGFQAEPDIAGVFAPACFFVAGIETVLSDLGKLHKVGEEGHVVVAGINGEKGACDSVIAGTCDGVVVMGCHATGVKAAEFADMLVKGESVKRDYYLIAGDFYTTAEEIEKNKENIWGYQKLSLD